MNSIQKRFLLFLCGCIVVRSLIAYFVKVMDPKFLPYAAIPALLLALSWFYLFFTNSRQTGPEVFGDKIWWNNLRPVHGLLYLVFAILAYQKKSYAWKVLVVDVVIGLISFLVFHYKENNFSKILM